MVLLFAATFVVSQVVTNGCSHVKVTVACAGEIPVVRSVRQEVINKITPRRIRLTFSDVRIGAYMNPQFSQLVERPKLAHLPYK